jgi:hypothetical protein
MTSLLVLVALSVLPGPNNLPWQSPVAVYGTGATRTAASADARSRCSDQLFALDSQCLRDGGHFVPEQCFTASCRNFGVQWTCDGKGGATCQSASR